MFRMSETVRTQEGVQNLDLPPPFLNAGLPFHLFASRLNPQLLQSAKLKMASQPAPSSAAMEVASGEEVIISGYP